MEFDPPIDIGLPVDVQVERAYRDGVITECNDAMAQMYGLRRASDLTGVGLDFMLPSADPVSRAYVASIVEAGYRAAGVESTERDVAGGLKHFDNSMSGVIEDGRLLRMSGTQRDVTEQKRRQAAGDAEARFRAMADASPVMIWVSGPGGLSWANARWMEFTGRRLEQERGDGWIDGVHPDDRARVVERRAAAREAREPFTQEFRLKRHDGEFRWLADSGAPLPAGAEPAGCVGSCIDITERKRHDEAAAHLAAIVASSDDAIIAKDLDGIIRSCNAAAERLFGYTAPELVGRPVRVLIPADRQQEEDVILGRIRRGDRIEHFETERLTRDGRLIDVSLTVSPVRDASGTIIGVSKIARDITERKRAAAEIAAQQQWFRVTLGSIGDAVIACDPEARVTYLNASAEALTGWPVAEATGRPLREVFQVVDEVSGQPVDDPASQVMETGQAIAAGHDTLLLTRDGTRLPIDDSAAPIRAASGGVAGMVLVFRDVTERRRAEAERLAAAADHGRLLAAERAARAEAERANRVKDEFVAMVSHELRTPLNAILGWTDLMHRVPGDATVIERGLDVISRNTRAQAQLIADLLDMSRIVSGKLRLEIQSVDLRDVVHDAVDAVARDADRKGIGIALAVGDDVGPIAGDAGRFQQILWNLLSNAVKFTPEGGRITVSLARSGPVAEIGVADTGAGIRPDVLPHVFDWFHQGDRTITRRFGGLGLGLSIVKHLVELHGGSVRAESAGEGHGSLFTLRVPVADRLQPQAPRPAGRPAEPVALESLRVLLVEDEPDTLEYLRRLLGNHGAIVTTAPTAREALDAFRRQRPDLLISDIGLPEMDGYDLIKQIRHDERPGARAMPAIALTAYARAEDRLLALRAGFDAHVAKPAEPAELLAAAAGLIKLRDAPP